MSSLLFGGKNLFNSLPRLPFCPGRLWRIGWIHPSLYIVLVQFILFFKSSWWKVGSAARNLINSAHQAVFTTTFAFSSVFILLLLYVTDYCGTRGATNILRIQLGMLPFTFFGLVSFSFYNKHTWDGHARYWRCMFVYNQIFSVFLVRSLSNFQLCLNFSFKIFKKFPNGKIGYY